MTNPQHSDNSTESTLYPYLFSFVNTDEPDTLLEWRCSAENRKQAYVLFWHLHDNPELQIVSCEKFTATTEDWLNDYHDLEIPTEALELLRAAYKETTKEFAVESVQSWRGILNNANNIVRAERGQLPEFIYVSDEMLIRAVYVVSHLYLQDGENTFRQMSNALHAIGAHSQRFTAEYGEPALPSSNTEIYTYLRDAAMALDYIAYGDNAAYTSDMATDVNKCFPDLTNSDNFL
jgi:hypothetical protein